MRFEIMQGGLLTTVQDQGRKGYAGQGFPECGWVDKRMALKANLLVGNPPDAAVLEAAMFGPQLRFFGNGTIAVMGSASPRLNGILLAPGQAAHVFTGDMLEVGEASGRYAYIALGGGVDVPLAMSSRSTDIRSGFGGFEGRPLCAGDLLATCPGEPVPWLTAPAFAADTKAADDLSVIRAVRGPDLTSFDEANFQTFGASIFTISRQADRMGIRLEGAAIQPAGGADILSNGILEGSVQIAADGHPIVMLADHQTAGGYAKIATVIPKDIPLIAQLRPGQQLRFRLIDLAEALAIHRAEAAEIQTWLDETEAMQHEQHRKQAGSTQARRSERRPRRELRCLHHRHGRGGYSNRHISQCGVRLSRR